MKQPKMKSRIYQFFVDNKGNMFSIADIKQSLHIDSQYLMKWCKIFTDKGKITHKKNKYGLL